MLEVARWDEIVREYSLVVHRIALRLTGDEYDAEDLTQDVFVRVFESLHRYRPGSFQAWLRRITVNLFLDDARRTRLVRFEGLSDDAAERTVGRERRPAEAYEARHLDLDVQAALARLAPALRDAVVLRDVEELTYQEIGDRLGVGPGTVRSRIHRGRRQLRDLLDARRPRPPASSSLAA